MMHEMPSDAWPLQARDPIDVSPLARASSLVVTTHLAPDGDGIGAELALQRGLEALGKDVRILNEDVLPHRYRFLDRDRTIEVAGPEHQALATSADLLIVVDTNDPARTGVPFGMRGSSPVCVIDHHLGRVTSEAHQICDPDCSSTGELIYRVLTRLGVRVGASIAEPIYASILYDTGSFRFIRNRSETLRVAADLLDRGVDAVGLQEHIFASKPRDLPLLLARIFSRLRYEADGRIVWTTIRRSDTEGLTLDSDDLREVIGLLSSLEGVDAAFVLKETEPGSYRLSIRSKRGINVFHIAERRGGGGHAMAAGAPVTGDPDTAAQELVLELTALL
jgi:bifunctional oligoribonuclease and PAP phosphatase NrnA